MPEWILEAMLTSYESFRRFLKNSNSPTHCHFVWMSRCMQQKQILNHFFFFLNRQSWAMNSFSMYIIILRILKIKGNKESAICFFGMRSDNSESYMFIPAYLNFTEAAFNFLKFYSTCVLSSFSQKRWQLVWNWKKENEIEINFYYSFNLRRTLY